MTVYGYTRVSTDRQAAEGESLIVQNRNIAGYAMMLGLSVDRTFEERGVSGSKPLNERPEGAALLAAVKPGDVIITAKLDRMFRSAVNALTVLEELTQQGVSLHMIDLGGDVTTNGISKLVFTILSAVAEAERDRIRERISTVKADQKLRGRYLGGKVPLGWRLGVDGQLVEDANGQRGVRRILELHNEKRSLRSIAGELTNQGFSVTHESVRKIIQQST